MRPPSRVRSAARLRLRSSRANAPAYTLVNLDARMKLTMLKGLENSYFQLNVYNLFDEFYVGGFNGGLNQAFSGTSYGNPNFVQIGAPRTVSERSAWLSKNAGLQLERRLTFGWGAVSCERERARPRSAQSSIVRGRVEVRPD